MLTVLGAVLPLFATILAGAGLARWRRLGDAAVGALNTYVVWLALPALLFDFVAQADWASLDQPAFAIVFGGSAFGIFALSWFASPWLTGRRQSLAHRSLEALTAGYANTAFMGIPLAATLLGPQGLAAAVIASLLTVCALFALSVTLVEVDRGREGPRGQVLRRTVGAVARNPIVAAPVAGALWAVSGLALPLPVSALLKMLGGSATPVALVTIGMFLVQPSGRAGTRELTAALVLKLVGQPLLVAALLLVVPLDHTHAAAALLLAALPTGTGPFMAARLYGEEVTLSARAMLVGTVLSVGSVSALAWWVG